MNLIIDAGNTTIKVSFFESGQLVYSKYILGLHQEFKNLFEEYPKISSVLICDVRGLDWDFLRNIFDPKNIYTPSSSWIFPFESKYKTPNTLGIDRIGLIAGASKIYPFKDVLVIDVGSCITYDLLNKENIYLGGIISPGYNMRYKSLKEFTGKLPLVENVTIKKSLGDDTKTSIQTGVFHGIYHEISGQIDYFRYKYDNLIIVLTGGDCHQLSKRLKNPIFVHPNFLVKGLNDILELNKTQI
tara:strand:- start:3170 stop:3898 length:729 start_codon:yes stop_codon:yes gene_type:complete